MKSGRLAFWMAVVLVATGGLVVRAEVAQPASALVRVDQRFAGHVENSSGTDSGLSEHTAPIAPVLFGIVVIILGARLGGHLLEALGQPSVLGELLFGAMLGNVSLLGLYIFDFLKVDWFHSSTLDLSDPMHCAGVSIDMLAQLGVILLLFQVGLENSVSRIWHVGKTAVCVAFLGVSAPFLLGWGCAVVLLPDAKWAVHMFLGAVMCATSVGITARVFRDLQRSDSPESQVVLAAAVIDDVLALIVLSLVQGLIVSVEKDPDADGFNLAMIAAVVAKAVGFLVLALTAGPFISRSLFRVASFLRGKGLLTAGALLFCFGSAWVASRAGLAPIIGAFAAGLVLQDVHYRELAERTESQRLKDLLLPIAGFIVPVFFVMMGVRIDLRHLADPNILGLAAAMTIAAIIGKQFCALGVWRRDVDRLTVGIGMVPRGEVGLILAGIGLQLEFAGKPLLTERTFSAVVVMVIATTLITPPLLKWSSRRSTG